MSNCPQVLKLLPIWRIVQYSNNFCGLNANNVTLVMMLDVPQGARQSRNESYFLLFEGQI